MLAFALGMALGAARLTPVDQCSHDSAFVAFRAKLARAAERRDAPAIMSMLDDEVMIDFGGGYGKAAFAQAWRLDSPKQSRLWSELKTILRLGCVKESGGWQLPSFKTDFEIDPMTTLWAVVPGSWLRAKPSNDAPRVARLDWDLLKLHEITVDEDWLSVSLHNGTKGYVRKEQVRSPLDYRITVGRTSGVFRITAFVAGD